MRAGRFGLARLPGYERLWRWCRRNPGLASLNAIAAGLTITLALAATVAAYTYRAQRNALEAERQQTRRNLTRAEQAEKDLRSQLELTQEAERKANSEQRRANVALGNSLLTEAAALQRGGATGQRFQSLDRLTRAAAILRDDPEGRDRIAEIRDHVIAAMGLTDLRITSRLPVPANTLTACDEQFTRYAHVDLRTRETVICRLADGVEVMRLPPPNVTPWYAKANFSPGGQFLRVRHAVHDERGITEVWDLARRGACLSRGNTVGRLFVPPRRPALLLRAGGSGLAVWDFKLRRIASHLALDIPVPNALLLDAGRRRLVCNDDSERDARLLDVDTGREVGRLTGSIGRNSMAISGDGRLLASGDSNGSVFVWDMAKHLIASSLLGHTQYIGGCQFVPRSHLLATSSWDDTLRLWDASLGRPLVTLKQAQVLGVSADGNRLALRLGESELALAEIAYSDSYQVLNPEMVGNRSHEDNRGDVVRAAAFSADGHLLAIALQEGIHLYDGKSSIYLGNSRQGPAKRSSSIMPAKT